MSSRHASIPAGSWISPMASGSAALCHPGMPRCRGIVVGKLPSRLSRGCRFLPARAATRVSQCLCRLGLCRPRRFAVVPVAEAFARRPQSRGDRAAISFLSCGMCDFISRRSAQRGARRDRDRFASDPPGRHPAGVRRRRAVAEVARERARQLLAGTAPAVLVLEIRYGPDGPVASLCDATDGVPQSLAFKLPHQVSELSELLRRSQLARMEFLDLARSRVPRSMHFSGCRFLTTCLWPMRSSCPRKSRDVRWFMPCMRIGQCRISRSPGRSPRGPIVCWLPTHRPLRAALALGLRRSVTRLDVETRCDASPTPSRGKAERLGLVPVRGCAWEQRFMHGVIAGLEACRA